MSTPLGIYCVKPLQGFFRRSIKYQSAYKRLWSGKKQYLSRVYSLLFLLSFVITGDNGHWSISMITFRFLRGGLCTLCVLFDCHFLSMMITKQTIFGYNLGVTIEWNMTINMALHHNLLENGK